jgi:ferrochelatase
VELSKQKKGFIVLAYGGPRSLNEVSVFLKRIFGSEPPPHILELNLKKYEKIGGKSPVCSDVENFAEKLSMRLSDMYVRYGFRFSEPTTEAVIESAFQDGIREFYLFPLMPFYSEWSFRGYFEPVMKVARQPRMMTARFLAAVNYSVEPEFLEIWKKLIQKELDSFKPDYVIFTAHSLPLDDRAAKTVYKAQLEAFSQTVSKELSIPRYRIAFQSRGRRGGEWLSPNINEVLDSLKDGTRVLVAPVCFIQENLETLYDLDIEAREHAMKRGIEFRRTTTPIYSPEFLDFAANLISRKHIWQEINWEDLEV